MMAQEFIQNSTSKVFSNDGSFTKTKVKKATGSNLLANVSTEPFRVILPCLKTNTRNRCASSNTQAEFNVEPEML